MASSGPCRRCDARRAPGSPRRTALSNIQGPGRPRLEGYGTTRAQRSKWVELRQLYQRSHPYDYRGLARRWGGLRHLSIGTTRTPRPWGFSIAGYGAREGSLRSPPRLRVLPRSRDPLLERSLAGTSSPGWRHKAPPTPTCRLSATRTAPGWQESLVSDRRFQSHIPHAASAKSHSFSIPCRHGLPRGGSRRPPRPARRRNHSKQPGRSGTEPDHFETSRGGDWHAPRQPHPESLPLGTPAQRARDCKRSRAVAY